MKLDDERNKRMTILVELRFRFPALEAHSHRFSLPSLFFFFFSKESRWLDGCGSCHVCVFSIREICRTRENWLAKRQAKERNESTFNPLCSIVSIRGDPGCAKISLLLFPIASTDPTDPIVGNSFERDDAANLGFLRYLVFFFFLFRKWSLPRITSKTFNPASF